MTGICSGQALALTSGIQAWLLLLRLGSARWFPTDPTALPPSFLLLKAPPQHRGSAGGGEPQKGQTAPVSWTCLCPPWACCQLPGSRPDGSLVLTRGQELEEASCPEEGRTEKAGQREAHRMAWVADLANGSWLLFLL